MHTWQHKGKPLQDVLNEHLCADNLLWEGRTKPGPETAPVALLKRTAKVAMLKCSETPQ